MLAEHGGVLKRLLLPFKLGVGGRVGSGKQWMSWITLDDEVGAIMHAIESESLRGPVNLVAPTPVVNAEFTSTLGKVLHRPTVLPTPLLPLKLVYGSELVELLLLVSQRVTPTRLEASGYTFLHPTLEAGFARCSDADVRIWVDSDIGGNPDDAIALLCALAHPDVELVGVSTVDADVEKRADEARRLLRRVPVVAGLAPAGEVSSADALLLIGPWTHGAGAGPVG